MDFIFWSSRCVRMPVDSEWRKLATVHQKEKFRPAADLPRSYIKLGITTSEVSCTT